MVSVMSPIGICSDACRAAVFRSGSIVSQRMYLIDPNAVRPAMWITVE